ncbi:ABC transporter permease [Methanohalophilus sp. RSK]|uniref:ABC transporter permease n=1 Tax=Methanohalophilus sp. RSK TaxID=2485783 RepID=UPI000F43A880|nr:ABC transporter permease [Methanohalophilus sp. RSK]RNI11903.1 ABC transporter permease [Methanohalophilus sp. RSK]
MTVKNELRHAWIITVKEIRQLSRKKALMVPLFLFPIIMIIFFGYGMGGTVKNAPILIVNDDTGTDSASLIQEIGAYTSSYNGNPMFTVTYTRDMSQAEAESKIDAGIYKAVLLIPHDYSERLIKNDDVTLTLLTDASDPTTSGIIISFMQQLMSRPGPVSLDIPNIYGNLEYLDFLTPAVIALTIFMGSVATTGSAIAGEKEDGTIVRILMTPVSRRSVILGKTIYQLILQLARAVILILAAYFLVGFHMNGSWLLVALVLTIFTLGGVGMGIVMSTRVDDMESFFQLNLLFTLPSMFITGVFFPLSSIPDWMRYIAYCLPLTYANDAMRTIMIKGQGLSAISTDLIILTLFALITFSSGVHLFRREA